MRGQLISLVEPEAIAPRRAVLLIAIQLHNRKTQLIKGLKVSQAGRRRGRSNRQCPRRGEQLFFQDKVIAIRNQQKAGIDGKNECQRSKENSAEQPGRRCLLRCRQGALVPQDYFRKEPGKKCPLRRTGRDPHWLSRGPFCRLNVLPGKDDCRADVPYGSLNRRG